MTNRVLLSASAFKVSKPGYDVVTTGPENLMFDGSYRGLKLFGTGTVSVPIASTAEVTFGSLPYTPLVIVQQVNSGSSYGGYWFETAVRVNPATVRRSQVGFDVSYNETKIYITNYADFGSTRTARWIVFEAPAGG